MSVYILVWSFILPSNIVYHEVPKTFKSMEACSVELMKMQHEIDEGSGECLVVKVGK